MNTLPVYHNPHLVDARAPYAAVITAGRKKPGGGMRPGSTERFWIGVPNADWKSSRYLHPDFAAFNADTKEERDKAAQQQRPVAQASLRAMLAHADLRSAYSMSWSCYRGPAKDERVTNPQHQGRWCYGDGTTASRWDGQEYREIKCPGDDCPFSKMDHACTVFLDLLLIPRWVGTPWQAAGMPEVLMRYASRGRRMLAAFRGLIEHAEELAAGFGFTITNWQGLPFRMTLSLRTGPNRKYTDVAFAPDGDLAEWLKAKRAQTLAITGRDLEPMGLLDPAMLAPEQHAEAEDLVSPEPILRPAIVSAQPAEVEIVEEAEPAPPEAGEVPTQYAELWAAVKAAGFETQVVENNKFGPPWEWTPEAAARIAQRLEAKRSGM